MSDEPRYEPIDDDLPPPDPDDLPSATSTPKLFKPPANVSKGMPPRKPPVAPLADKKAEAKDVQSAPPTAQAEPAPEKVPPEPVALKVDLALPAALVERMNTLRQQAGIARDVPPTIPLITTISTLDETAFRESIAAFEKTHLPLSLTLKQVQAEVRDKQRYIAAWQVDAEPAFQKLRDDLLEELHPAAEAISPFDPMIVVGQNVPAKQFPALVAAMQREFDLVFERLTWRIENIGIEVVNPPGDSILRIREQSGLRQPSPPGPSPEGEDVNPTPNPSPLHVVGRGVKRAF